MEFNIWKRCDDVRQSFMRSGQIKEKHAVEKIRDSYESRLITKEELLKILDKLEERIDNTTLEAELKSARELLKV